MATHFGSRFWFCDPGFQTEPDLSLNPHLDKKFYKNLDKDPELWSLQYTVHAGLKPDSQRVHSVKLNALIYENHEKFEFR